MKRRLVIMIMTVILLLLAAAAGVLFLVRPSVIDMQRRAAEDQLIALIEEGHTQIEAIPVPAMEGEEAEFPEMEEQPAIAIPELDPGEIKGYGIILIPSIDLKMPLVQGADSYSLRAAAGWYPESAEMGEAGNCVIFGHRMTGYGRHFNRLDELKAGDSIFLYNMDGDRFAYVVADSEVIEPGVLMDTLREHNEGFNLTLVTCTPTGVCSHRLMVYAELNTSEKAEG